MIVRAATATTRKNSMAIDAILRCCLFLSRHFFEERKYHCNLIV